MPLFGGDDNAAIRYCGRSDIISSGLRGRPVAVPSAMRRPHSIAARASKESTRPEKRAGGPSALANQASRSRRLRGEATSRTPCQILATLNAAMKRSSIGLTPNPVRDGSRGTWLGCFADDVRVEEVACHRSTSRGGTASRSRLRSAPTRGDWRSASQMLPRLGSPPATRCAISVRNR
jgi:hypothetical protein